MRAGSPPATMPCCCAEGASQAGDSILPTSRCSFSLVWARFALPLRSCSSRYESAIACVVSHNVVATPAASSPIIMSTKDARERGQRIFSRLRAGASADSGSGFCSRC